MSDARRGYSHAMARVVATLDQSSVIGQFATYCVSNDIPVDDVARAFKVTRSTVYNWFKGVYSPRERQIARMQEVLAKASAASA